MAKKSTEKKSEMNQKSFLKLLQKCEKIKRQNSKEKRKLEKLIVRITERHDAKLHDINQQLARYSEWVKSLAQS